MVGQERTRGTVGGHAQENPLVPQFPQSGSQPPPIAEIRAHELLSVLYSVEVRGRHETRARRVAKCLLRHSDGSR